MSDEPDEAIVVAVSDFLDGLGSEQVRAETAAKIASAPAWTQVHADMLDTRKALSGLQKARAPATFATDVTSTIHKRSAGRFFARRTLGDRVPFSVLAIFAVLAIAALGFMMWSSQNGSLERSHEPGPVPDRTPVVPTP
jgi:hypothetical protein